MTARSPLAELIRARSLLIPEAGELQPESAGNRVAEARPKSGDPTPESEESEPALRRTLEDALGYRREERRPRPPRPILEKPAPSHTASVGELAEPRVAPSEGKATPAILERVGDIPLAPDWIGGAQPLDLRSEAVGADANTETPAPLFQPKREKAILREAVSMPRPTDLIDVAGAVQAVALGELLYDPPRFVERKLPPGVQVLVDESVAMQPFLLDQQRVVANVVRIVGADRVQALGFVGSPLRGVRHYQALSTERPLVDNEGDLGVWAYRAPPRGNVVLLLTDVGIMRGLDLVDRPWPREWRRFADQLSAAGCPVVAFVPYSQAAWPKALTTSMALVEWDRRTSDTQARRAVRNARDRVGARR